MAEVSMDTLIHGNWIECNMWLGKSQTAAATCIEKPAQFTVYAQILGD